MIIRIIYKSESDQQVVRRGIFDKKTDSRALNAEFYSDQLERIYASPEEKYPSLVNRKLDLFLQDNTRYQTARRTMAKLEELEGI